MSTNQEQVRVNESFTIENFVDGVNEVLLQVTKDENTFNAIQSELDKFTRGEIDVDAFMFEFTMLVKGIKYCPSCESTNTYKGLFGKLICNECLWIEQ